MANYDYLSISRYIRDKVLNKRIKIDRSIVLTDRVFRNQINSLSAIVAHIGLDYNQTTKRFNSLVKQKREGDLQIHEWSILLHDIHIEKRERNFTASLSLCILMNATLWKN